MVISCMYLPKLMQELGSILGNMFQMETLTALHLLYAFKAMLNSYQCISYLGLFCITDHNYWMS